MRNRMHSMKKQLTRPQSVVKLRQISTDFSPTSRTSLLIPNARYGQPLVHFDAAAEARLRLKIDLYIVPTVSLLYLFCFIDRANIGGCTYYPTEFCLTMYNFRQRQNRWIQQRSQARGIRLQSSSLRLLHLLHPLRNSFQHSLQDNRSGMVHPKHLTRFWYLLRLHRFCA